MAAEIQYLTKGKTRRLPLSDNYTRTLSEIVSGVDPDLTIVVTSAGQAPKGSGGARTGSVRHDVDHTGHAHTSDFVLKRGGKIVRPGDDPDLYSRVIEAAATKFPGIGHYSWGIHVGGGKPAFWGPTTKSASADPVFLAAYNRGRARANGQPVVPQAHRQPPDVNRDASPASGAPPAPPVDPFRTAVTDAVTDATAAADKDMLAAFTPETMPPESGVKVAGDYSREDIEAEMLRRGMAMPERTAKQPAVTAAPNGYSKAQIEAEMRRRGMVAPGAVSPTTGPALMTPLDAPVAPPVSPTDLITPVPGIGPLAQGLKQLLPKEYQHLVDEAVRGAGFGWTDQAVGAASALVDGGSPTPPPAKFDVKNSMADAVDMIHPYDTKSFGERAEGFAAGDRAASDAARKQEMARGESVGILGYDITPGDITNTAGMLAAGAGVGSGVPLVKGAVAKTAVGAGEGAALASIMAGGSADAPGQSRVEAAIGAAPVGAIAGGVLTRAGVSLDRYLSRRAAMAGAETGADLKARAGAMIEAAENAGVYYKPDNVRGLKMVLDSQMKAEGYRPTIHGKLRRFLNEVRKDVESGTPVDLKKIAEWRTIATDLQREVKRGSSESRMLGMVRERLDNFSLDERNIATAGANEVKARMAARAEYHQGMKAVKIEEMIEDATFQAASAGSGGNINNAIKQNFKNFWKNRKNRVGFTPEERQAIEKVIESGVTADTLRLIGKLSPGGNGLMMALNLGAAGATGGMSLFATGIGSVAKSSADAIGSRKAQFVLTTILNGKRPPPSIVRTLSKPERRMIGRALIASRAEAIGSEIPVKEPAYFTPQGK